MAKCKHCGEFLEGAPERPMAPATQRPDLSDVAIPRMPGFRQRVVEQAIAKRAAQGRVASYGQGAFKGSARGNSPMVTCPHCGTKGTVDTIRVKMKKGISGGKATAAVLTSGFSMLATGLSRKEEATQARCKHCGVEWVMG